MPGQVLDRHPDPHGLAHVVPLSSGRVARLHNVRGRIGAVDHGSIDARAAVELVGPLPRKRTCSTQGVKHGSLIGQARGRGTRAAVRKISDTPLTPSS
jgi:hypothetical protein